jgi:hypothetical protein
VKKLLVLLVAAFLLVSVASAATIAMTINIATPPAGSSALMRGWAFTLANTTTVSRLGWYDAGQDGLTASHQIGIWDITGGTLFMSGTVSSGTADPLTDRFRFTSNLSGTTTLAPGGYVIGGLSDSGDGTVRLMGPGDVTFAPGISYIQDRVGGGTFSYPASTGGFDIGYFGPNFLVGEAAVPEPATLFLVGGALSALTSLRRRRGSR